MKRIILFVLLFAAIKVAGQTTGYLRFDTVKIMKQNGTCELYIINKTKDSLGLLTNIGGGLTSFKKPRKLNDSTFTVGNDTLIIPGSGGNQNLQQVLTNGSTLTTNHTITIADSITFASGKVLAENLRLTNLSTVADTALYKPTVHDALGNEYNFNRWPGSGSGIDSLQAGYGIVKIGDTVKVDTTTIDARYKKRFNVINYGADPDSNGTDDCPAIKAAMQAAYDAGGGIVYFPLGHYTLGCALDHSEDGVDPDAQIVLPLTRDTATRKPRITFEGEAWNNWSAELATVQAKNRKGSIIESTILDTGYVFGSSFYNDVGFGGDINWTWWGFKNLDIRVRSKTSGTEISSTMSGIDAFAPRSVNLDHVKVTVQSAEGSMIAPYSGTIGVRLPHWNNNGNIHIDNLNVSGYYNGVYGAEHMMATEINTFSCHNGLYLPYQLHSGYIAQYTSEGCVNHIFVSNGTGSFVGGPMNLHINSYNVEHYTVGGHWNTFEKDIAWADTSFNCHILIDYASISESFVGRVPDAFITDAPQRTTVGYDAELGSRYLYRDIANNWPMARGVSTSNTDGNLIKLMNTAGSMGFSFGNENGLAAGNSGFMGGRGLTYSANSNQRGNVIIGAGVPSSPSTNEGSILLFTNGAPRLRIRNDGSFRLNDSTGFQLGTSSFSNDVVKFFGQGGGASFQVQNNNPVGFAGIEYVDDGGNTAVFTGFNNGNDQEFRFNNIKTGGYISFITNSLDRFRINYSGGVTFNNAFTLPIVDGTSGQILTTNGSGVVTWQTPGAAITSINSQTDASQTISGNQGIGVSSSSGVHTISLNTTLESFLSDVNNTGTSETDLFSHTLSANRLTLNGHTARFVVTGTTNDATATHMIQGYFAGNVIYNSGGEAISATGGWRIEMEVTRTSSTTARASVRFEMDNATINGPVQYTALTSLDFTTTNIFKVTGTAGGAGGGSNDITATVGKVTFIP